MLLHTIFIQFSLESSFGMFYLLFNKAEMIVENALNELRNHKLAEG